MTRCLSFCLLLLALTVASKPSPCYSEVLPDRYVLFVSFSDLFVDISNPIPPFFPLFGSIEAADYYANEFAHQAGLINWDGTSTVYQAVLSTIFTSAINRLDLQPGIPVVNTAGGQIIASAPDLFTGVQLTAPILEEFGATPFPDTKVWTGTSASGLGTGDTCGDWSSPVSVGTVGLANATDSNWIQNINQLCGNPGRIYGIGPESFADFDSDGDVDDADLAQWEGDYGVNGDSDADGDGDADGLDFLMWQTRLGYDATPLAASSTIPEPTTCGLALAATLLFAIGRRRSH